MALLYQTINATGSGNIIPLSDNMGVVVAAGVLVGSTDANGIFGGGSFQYVQVYGTVIGDVSGIELGSEFSSDTGNGVRVAENGAVHGSTQGINLNSDSSFVINDGTISSKAFGVSISGSGIQGGFNTVTNRGVISGYYGLQGSGTTLRVFNYGTIEGIGLNGYAMAATGSGDLVVNRGVMIGNVFLAEGDDRFDNRGGRIEEGVINCFSGNDTVLPGVEDKTIDGGTEHDVLDFKSSGALRVSLVDDTGTGRAEGDIYTGFERVIGSRSGGDTLIGDAVSNALLGMGGNDALLGGAGNDFLQGGLGGDTLTGGANNDAFQYTSINDISDVITDFRNFANNDDYFRIAAAGFGGGLASGTLAAGQFQTRADNVAQDANDRFIFRTTDRTLWFDRDGTGASGPLLVADLDAGATVTNVDITIF